MNTGFNPGIPTKNLLKCAHMISTSKTILKKSLHLKDNTPIQIHKAGEEIFNKLVHAKDLKLILASPEQKKSSGVNYLITNKDSGKKYKLKLKTTTNDTANITDIGVGIHWRMDVVDESNFADDIYFCFIQIIEEADRYFCRIFVVPSEIVSKFIKNAHKYWRGSNTLKGENSRLRWFVLGGDFPENKIEIPYQVDYEDKWGQLN